ncbi:MAG: hypothetical protein P8J27_02480 [Mariniblastus sp.]|nr:hypothetical protein [Mariniblastus sp.]
MQRDLPKPHSAAFPIIHNIGGLSNANNNIFRDQQLEFISAAQKLKNMFNGNGEFDSDRCTRKHKRRMQSISVSVQPLDRDFKKSGEMFWVVSRDISIKGICLICNDPIKHAHIRIGLMNETVTAIGRIKHSTSVESRFPLYLVGVEFLNELV